MKRIPFLIIAFLVGLGSAGLSGCKAPKAEDKPAEEKNAGENKDTFLEEARKEITADNAEAKADELEKEILADTE
jgi:hypothetical protein